jgi:hypothetical protein
MDCHNVQEMLSPYIEGIISPEEGKLIDEHLSACSKCKEALYDLKKTLEYVQNLEDVEPPEWLTQTVMTRIRSETEPRKGILQKLFYPLYIKLPIEAVAVVLIAVTALYIFKTIQPEIKPAKSPPEETTARIPSQEKEEIPSISKSKENVIPPSPPLEKGGKRGFEAERNMLAKKPYKIDKYEPKAPTQVLKDAKVTPETRPSAGIATKDESKSEVLGRAPKAKALSEKKVEVINLTIHIRNVETAIKEIEKSLIQHGAGTVKIEHQDDKDLIYAKVDSQKLKQLITKFKEIGEFEEKTITSETIQGNIEIRIEIVRK